MTSLNVSIYTGLWLPIQIERGERVRDTKFNASNVWDGVSAESWVRAFTPAWESAEKNTSQVNEGILLRRCQYPHSPQRYGMISAHLFLPRQPCFPTPFFPFLRWSCHVFPSLRSTEPHFTTTCHVFPPFLRFYFTTTFPFIVLSPSLCSTESHFTQPAVFPPLPHISTSPHLPA